MLGDNETFLRTSILVECFAGPGETFFAADYDAKLTLFVSPLSVSFPRLSFAK